MSDVFWSILIIFRELLNISKAYIKSWMDYWICLQTFYGQILIYVISPLFFTYALLIFSNSLKMIKINQNMSEFFWIVCKSITLTLAHLLVLFYELSFHSILYFINSLFLLLTVNNFAVYCYKMSDYVCLLSYLEYSGLINKSPFLVPFTRL